MSWRVKLKNDWGRLDMSSKYKSVPLRDLVSFVSKGIAPKYSEEKTKDTIVVLNQKTNRNFIIDYSLARLNDVTKKKIPEDKLVRDNDILINSTGVGTAGRIAQIFSVPEPTTVDGHMIIVRPDTKKINPIYLGYIMKAQQSLIENLQEGSTGQTELNRQRLLDEIVIVYPESRKDQEEIAKLFFSLDNRISENKKINQNLEEMAQAIFKSWFIDLEPFGGEMPFEWKKVDFEEISTIQNGFAFKSKDYIDEGVRMIRTTNFDNGFVNNHNLINLPLNFYSDPMYQKFVFRRFDTVIVMVGASVGKISLITDLNLPALQNQNMWRFRPMNPNIPVTFIHYHVKEINNNVRGWSSGSARDFYRKDIFKKAKINLPTEKVLKDFSKITLPLFAQINNNILENDRLTQIRNMLLSQLLSSKL